MGDVTDPRGGRAVGRTANLQCSLGAVSRLSRFVFLPLEATDELFVYTQRGKYEEKQEYVEYNRPLSATKACKETCLV